MRNISRLSFAALVMLAISGCAADYRGNNLPENHNVNIVNESQKTVVLSYAKSAKIPYSEGNYNPIDEMINAAGGVTNIEDVVINIPNSITSKYALKASEIARARTAWINSYLIARGIDKKRIAIKYSNESDVTKADNIILKVNHLEITRPDCKNQIGYETFGNFMGATSPDFGCSTRNNLGVMIADPREMIGHRNVSSKSNPDSASNAIKAIRETSESLAPAEGVIRTTTSAKPASAK